jgi:PAS domain S-box-containing protein
MKHLGLSPRQEQILHLASIGLTDKAISKRLGVSVGTLRTYWDRLRHRLSAKSRTEVVAHFHRCEIEDLQASRDEVLRTLSALPLFVWTAKPNGEVAYCNDWFEHFGGRPAQEYLGEGCLALMPGEDHRGSTERWRRACDTREPYEANVRFRSGHDGSLHWHRIRLVPVLDRKGDLEKWVGMGHELGIGGPLGG